MKDPKDFTPSELEQYNEWWEERLEQLDYDYNMEEEGEDES